MSIAYTSRTNHVQEQNQSRARAETIIYTIRSSHLYELNQPLMQAEQESQWLTRAELVNYTIRTESQSYQLMNRLQEQIQSII